MSRTHTFTKRLTRVGLSFIAATALLIGTTSCSSTDADDDTLSDEQLAQTQQQVQQLRSKSVAFIGIGPFGGFLSALESDARDTLSQVGYSVSYSSVNRKNHLAQIEQFEQALTNKPDAIILAPTQNTGWAAELRRARQAGIPAILVARHLTPAEEKLATAYVGPSDVWAGQQAANYIVSLYNHGLRSHPSDATADGTNGPNASNSVNGVILAGATGQRQTNDRTEGWNDVIRHNKNIHVLSTVAGDWTQDSATTSMAGLIAQYRSSDLRFVFAQSDAMAIGATRAISNAGLREKIHVVSIDATKAGLQAVIDGSIDRSIEYNPLIGEKVSETLTQILQGKAVDADVPVESQVFDASSAREALPTRQY